MPPQSSRIHSESCHAFGYTQTSTTDLRGLERISVDSSVSTVIWLLSEWLKLRLKLKLKLKPKPEPKLKLKLKLELILKLKLN